MDSVMEHHDSICKQLWKEMETTAKFAVKFQQQIPIPIGEIQISLLLTSLYLGKPQIGIAAYDMREAFMAMNYFKLSMMLHGYLLNGINIGIKSYRR